MFVPTSPIWPRLSLKARSLCYKFAICIMRELFLYNIGPMLRIGNPLIFQMNHKLRVSDHQLTRL